MDDEVREFMDQKESYIIDRLRERAEKAEAEVERLRMAMASHKDGVYCSHDYDFTELCVPTCPEYEICQALADGEE